MRLRARMRIRTRARMRMTVRVRIRIRMRTRKRIGMRLRSWVAGGLLPDEGHRGRSLHGRVHLRNRGVWIRASIRTSARRRAVLAAVAS